MPNSGLAKARNGRSRSIAALVVDDNEDDAALLRHVAAEVPSYRITLEAQTDARAGLERALDTVWELIFLDYRLPGLDGVQWLTAFREGGGSGSVIALTGARDEYVAAEMTRAGADAYLSKADLGAERLKATLDDVLGAPERDDAEREVQAEARRLLLTLTAREREVLIAVAGGLTTRQIAKRLHRSPDTIKDHRAAVLHKLHARSSAEAVRLADLGGLDTLPTACP